MERKTNSKCVDGMILCESNYIIWMSVVPKKNTRKVTVNVYKRIAFIFMFSLDTAIGGGYIYLYEGHFKKAKNFCNFF